MATTRRDRGEGALYQESASGRWVGRIVVDGNRHKVTARTKTQAAAKLRALRRQAESGLPVTPGDLTVATLLADWSRKALPNRNLEPATVTMHRANIAVMTGDDLGRRRIRTLTPEQVAAFLERRSELGRARRTLAGYRTTLRLALGWAERRGVVARNVASVVELPATARSAKSGRTMTAEQARAFLAAAEDSPLSAMWTTMIYLGLRPGEAAGLSWGDIDETNGVVHIRQGRKIDERGAAVVGTLKTTYSIRSLDAPPAVIVALRSHQRRQARDRLTAGALWANPDDLAFTSRSGRPTHPTHVRNEFARIIERAGLGDGWTPNMLRHTAASLMADAGMPIEEVADQLGHRDTRMASLHYRHRIKPTVAGGTVLRDVLGA